MLAACTADTFVSAGDAGADAPSGIACGQKQCAATETCCVGSDGGAALYACATTCPSQQNVAALSCTQTSDCPSGVCCVGQSNNITSSRCEAQCTSNEVQLCNPIAADPGCPQTAPCSSSNIKDWNLPQSFGTCGGQGPP